ncbi:Serine/threonine protein kinase, partial [Coemansia sp. RSA 1694]
CMDCDLNELVVSRNGRRLPETVILDITYQVLNGLDFIHRNDLFHRDIKPENVLIRRHVTRAVSGAPPSAIVVEAKIADFGLVHDMDFSRPLTDYISTRWYRAPEVLLNCANYSTPIDVWAVGTIVSELATLRPLFPGTNQIDQLRRIFEVLGTPQISTGGAQGDDHSSVVDGAVDGGSWYEGAVHARKLGIAFVPSTRKPVASVMPDVSSALVQLVDYLLVLNPANRPTAREALVVVSRMLDHTLGEPQEGDMDAPNHQVPDMIGMDEEVDDERRPPLFPPPNLSSILRLRLPFLPLAAHRDHL